MSRTENMTARASTHMTKATGFGFIRELVIWNSAWREYHRLQGLDAAALRDLGLSEASRATVTVPQIAARMRG